MFVKKYVSDIIVSIAFYILAGIVLIGSGSINDLDSRRLPQLFAVIVVILSTMLLYKALKNKKRGADESIDLSRHKNVAIFTVMTLAYIYLSDIIGFYFITPVFLYVAMRYLKMKNKKALILVPLLMTVFTYFVFTSIFGLDVPHGKIININNLIRIF